MAPGSGLIRDLAKAEQEAGAIGYPVMLKGTAGGGGIGMALCENPDELKGNFERVRRWQSPILEMQEFSGEIFPPGPSP